MDPVGKPIDHSKIHYTFTHDDTKTPGSSLSIDIDPFAVHESAHENEALSPGRIASDIVSGKWDNELLTALLDDMKKLNAKRSSAASFGNQALSDWSLDSLMNMPMPGAGLYAPGIRRGLEFGKPFAPPLEPVMDLTAPPPFLADPDDAVSKVEKAFDKPPSESLPPGSAYSQALRQAVRRDICASIPSILDGLAKKEITRKEAISRLGELSVKVEKNDDPLLRMSFKRFLYDLNYRMPAADTGDTARMASLNPFLYVKYFGGDGGKWCHPIALENADIYAKYLREVQRQAGRSSIDPDTLRSVAHCAGEAYRKSFAEDITNEGASLSFREIARGCAWLINDWWKNGQIKILANGRPVPPGELDPGKFLCSGNVPVKGSAIDLGDHPPKAPDPEALKLAVKLRSIASSFSDSTVKKAIEEFREYAKTSPALASEAVSAFVDGMHPSPAERTSVLSSFGDSIFLGRAQEEPWLKELLKPQIHRIKSFTADAEARNILDGDDAKNLVRVYEGFAKGFPEAVDAQFLAGSLTPILLCEHGDSILHSRDDAIKLVKECWKKNPDLVKPTIDAIFSDRENLSFDRSVWDLIRLGVRKYGYEPGGEELQQIAARLSHIPLPTGGTLFDYQTQDKDYVGALGVLINLKQRNPGLLKELEVPDNRGAMVPLEQGLVNRVLADPKVGCYLEKFIVDDDHKNTFNFLTDLYPLISGNGAVRRDLLIEARSDYENAGSIDAMCDRGKAALALLAHFGPEKWHAPDVQAIFAKELLKSQADKALNCMVSYGRKEETEKLLTDISEGRLSTADSFQALDRIISMGYCATGTDTFLEPYLGQMRKAMHSAAADPGFMPHRDSMISDVEKSWANAGKVGDMPVEEIRKLNLLLVLAGDDEGLMQRMRPLMEPERKRERSLGYTMTAHQREAGAALAQYRRLLIEKNVELLKSGNLPPCERTTLDEENDRNKLGFDTTVERRFDDMTRDALLEGAAKDFESAGMTDFMSYLDDSGQKRWAFTVVARMTDRGTEIPGELKKLRSIIDDLPDQEQPASQGWSTTWNDDGEAVTTPTSNEDRRKMKKDLGKALDIYVLQRIDDLFDDLGNAALTRRERTALVNRGRGCHTMLHYGNPSKAVIQKTYDAFCKSIAGADPSTGITDLPAHFKNSQKAYQVYITLAPGAERDEEIGPEWQKFKCILEAMGGEENLDCAAEAFAFAKKKESEGYDWDRITAHIYKNLSLGMNYKEMPLIGDGDERPPATVEEFDGELYIDGLRLKVGREQV